jgi:Arc/MetJ-type ribon-helix-helix transcriptional regulator
MEDDLIRVKYEEWTVKLVVDIPDSLVGRIKQVVDDERYENPREFVTTAIENQLELEESDAEGFKTLNEAVAEFDAGAPDSSDEPEQEIEPNDVGTDGLGQREYDTVPTVTPPDGDRLPTGPLWGQYNKIFPTKLVVRRLANVIKEQNEDGTSTPKDGIQWIDLDQFRKETGELARNYGLQIKEFDEEQSRGRGEKLSAGLPTGEDTEKSVGRFQTHFVGRSKQDGSLAGAAPSLLFVDITDEDISRIGITETGLKFAELYNPLLDIGPDADEPLSADERDFYMDHMRQDLPAEHEAMETAAAAIADGSDRPDELTDRIARLQESWSESKANTMRSGIVSRMHELGLIERERVGQRGIAYTLTGSGEALLSDHEAGVIDG